MAHTLKISVCGSRGDPASPRDLPKCNVLSAGLSRNWTPPVCHALNHMRETEEQVTGSASRGWWLWGGRWQAGIRMHSQLLSQIPMQSEEVLAMATASGQPATHLLFT